MKSRFTKHLFRRSLRWSPALLRSCRQKFGNHDIRLEWREFKIGAEWNLATARVSEEGIESSGCYQKWKKRNSLSRGIVWAAFPGTRLSCTFLDGTTFSRLALESILFLSECVLIDRIANFMRFDTFFVWFWVKLRFNANSVSNINSYTVILLCAGFPANCSRDQFWVDLVLIIRKLWFSFSFVKNF